MPFPGEQLVARLWETIAEKGIGGYLTPWHMRRMAAADRDIRRDDLLRLAQDERDAAAIRSGRKRLTSTNELVDVPPGGDGAALQGGAAGSIAALVAEHIRREVNVSKAVLQAEAVLENDPQSPPNRRVDDDWLARWRDSAGQVSSEALREMWANALAGEIKEPGTFSLRTLAFLHNVSQEDAELIAELAPFVVTDSVDRNTFVFRGGKAAQILESRGLSEPFLFRLADLGIVSAPTPGLQLTLKLSVPPSGLWFSTLAKGGLALVVKPATGGTHVSVPVCRVTSLGSEILRLGSFAAADSYFARHFGGWIEQQGFKLVLDSPPDPSADGTSVDRGEPRDD